MVHLQGSGDFVIPHREQTRLLGSQTVVGRTKQPTSAALSGKVFTVRQTLEGMRHVSGAGMQTGAASCTLLDYDS